MRVKRLLALAISGLLAWGAAEAQTSDSLIYRQLQDYGITFTDNNRVTLLMSGQQKFDDMFAAIRQARHSVHLE